MSVDYPVPTGARASADTTLIRVNIQTSNKCQHHNYMFKFMISSIWKFILIIQPSVYWHLHALIMNCHIGGGETCQLLLMWHSYVVDYLLKCNRHPHCCQFRARSEVWCHECHLVKHCQIDLAYGICINFVSVNAIASHSFFWHMAFILLYFTSLFLL